VSDAARHTRAMVTEPLETGTGTSRTPVGKTVHILLWITLFGWLLFTGWRLFGPNVSWPDIIAMAYTPYVAAATVVPVVLAIFLRAGRLMAVFVLCGCLLASMLVSRVLPQNERDPSGPTLRVMTANVLMGKADLDAVVDLVDRQEVDVLSVQELTTEAIDGFNAAGLFEELPYRLEKPGEMAEGAAIYSRHPMAAAPDLAIDGLFWMPAARISVPGGGDVGFVAIHIAAPASFARIPHWRDELDAIHAADVHKQPRILAGDFNSTLDHSRFDAVLDRGYRDAAETVGNGMDGTWRAAGLPLPVTLDHVLFNRFVAARDTTTHELPGSDHRSLMATVALPDAKSSGAP
jgi:endonuclease/exonuclease/phosphatase (EEP) superfamily protein YafD